MKLLELNNRLGSTKKIIEQAVITTADITSEIDKNRELKDELK